MSGPPAPPAATPGQCARLGCGHREDRHDASRPGRPCEDCDPASGCRAWVAPRPLTAPDVVASLLADVADARAQLAGVQHGAGAWIREAVARETAGLTARLAEVTADRAHLAAKLAETLAANQRWAETLGDVQQAGRERDDARSAFATLAGHFAQGAQSGWTARVSGTVLRRLCVAAGCEPPSGSDAPDEAALSVATQGAHAIGEVAYCGFTAAKGGERICWEALDPAERQRWQQSATAVLARARAGRDAP